MEELFQENPPKIPFPDATMALAIERSSSSFSLVKYWEYEAILNEELKSEIQQKKWKAINSKDLKPLQAWIM